MSANWQANVGVARSAEVLLAELESLTGELIARVGPKALERDPACGGPDGVAALVDASARLRMIGHRLEVLRTTFLPLIDGAGLWALTGARTFATWLAATEQVGRATARREVRTATVLRDVLPVAREAALDGRLGPEHLRALVDVAPTSQARRDALTAPAVDAPFEDGRSGSDGSDSSDGSDGSPDGGRIEGRNENRHTDSTDTTDGTSTTADAGGAGRAGGVDRVEGADGGTDDIPGAGDVGNEPGRGGVRGTDADAGTAADGGALAGRSRVPTWEDQLLEWAGERQAEDFRGLVRYFAQRADPAADERGLKKARDKEYLNVSPTLDGFHVAGFLTPEHGELVTTALGSVMGAPAAEDDRTPGRRRAQGLADLARIALDNGHTGTGAAVRPHLDVTVSWTELQNLTHHTDQAPGAANDALFGAHLLLPTHSETHAGNSTPTVPSRVTGRPRPTEPAQATEPSPPREQTGPPQRYPAGPQLTPAVITGTNTPLPASLLRRITCDCEVTRIVFGPDAAVLDVGRAQRTVTGPMRRAVIARDKHCVWPGCDQPPARCEVHHAVRHWADGGTTSADNAALLCWHHHDRVDGQQITMHWTGNTNGTHHSGWTLTDRDGHQITLAGLPPLPGVREPAAAASRGARPSATNTYKPPADYRPPTEQPHEVTPDTATVAIRPSRISAPTELAA